jgi:hypothetical protein
MSSVAEVVLARQMIYLGMDVHKETITIAVLPAEATSPTRLDRLPNDLPKLKRWIERVARARRFLVGGHARPRTSSRGMSMMVVVRRVAPRLDVRALSTALCGPCSHQRYRDPRA